VSVAERLVTAGMSPAEAGRKAAMFGSLEREFGPAPYQWFVPGRVELLGKHTDYAGGRSLVCAVERGFCLLARARDDSVLTVLDCHSRERVSLTAPGGQATSPPSSAASGWAIYPATVLARVSRDFGITRGLDLALTSDLPAAAGLSSSSAFTVGTFLALAAVNNLQAHPAFPAALPTPLRCADYLGRVENGMPFEGFAGAAGVGTLGGCQDQTAILCSIPGEVGQFCFDPVTFERRIPFPELHVLVVALSGVVAAKTGAAMESYNAAARAVHEIERRWREASGRQDRSLARAAASGPGARGDLARLVADDPVLRPRLEQFLEESAELVPAAAEALHRRDLGRFGTLVDRSQLAAERGLRNQTPETIHLQRSARSLGAVAASAFGAGFGGSVWAMVEANRAERFLEDWKAGYEAAFPARAAEEGGGQADWFVTRPGPAATRIRESHRT